MAYTKTPEQSTHNRYRIPPRGNQTFTSNTRTYEYSAGLRYVNCYPTIRESKTTEPVVSLVKAPKLKSVNWTFDGGEPGITAYDYQTNLFVYKNYIFRNVGNGDCRLIYTAGDVEFLSCQKVIDYSGNGDVIIMGLLKQASDNWIYSWTYNETDDDFEQGENALAGEQSDVVIGPSEPIPDSYALVRDLFVDGYHIVATKAERGGTNRVYVSNAGDYNLFYTSTDFFVPEIHPDDVVDIQKHRNYICILGTHTIEFFYNAGLELGSPFVRQDNYTIPLGAAQNITFKNGLASIAYGDDIYFVASSENGGNAVYVIRNFQPIKISDDYIDYVLNNQEGVVKNVPRSNVELGLVDVMGNVQLCLQFRSPSSNYLNAVFLFNERDMVWWEWSESGYEGFVTSAIGPGSNLAGKPFFLDGSLLGVASNAQFSVVVPDATPYYTNAPISILGINAALQKASTVTFGINSYLKDTTEMDIDASLLKPFETLSINGYLTA